MLPLTYEPGSGSPQRLPAVYQTRGHSTESSPVAGVLFGTALVAAGAWITLCGLRILKLGGRLNIPHEMLVPIGAVGIGAGLFMWVHTWLRRQDDLHHRAIRLRHPDEPALADYPWNPEGTPSRLRHEAVRRTLIACFLALFLTPFNYVAFAEKDPHLMMQVIVGLFDLIILYLIGDTVPRWARVCKFGEAVLRFERFPLSTREPVKLAWTAPAGCTGMATGSFTLRAIREWVEVERRGKSRHTRIIHEQQWSGAWKIASAAPIVPGQVCELTFELPENAPSSALRADRPLFWELEVDLQLPGLNFKDTYLVPIYGPRRA
jgi:hypothetical protein